MRSEWLSNRVHGDRHTRQLRKWAKSRWQVVRSSFASAVQVGLSAGLAWWLATLLLPWEEPLYAPIGAVVAIGTGEDRLLKRPLRLLAGMVIAVAVAGVVVSQLGGGAWQIALVTLLTTLLGRFLFDDTLARTYSAFHGAVIAALGADRVIPEQLVEAALGAVVGIVVVHLVFPPGVRASVLSPVENAGNSARRLLRSLVTALRSGDVQEAERAVNTAFEVESRLTGDDDRRRFGRQLSRLAPARRGQREMTEQVIDADEQLTELLLGTAHLARLVRGVLLREDGTYPAIADALEDVDLALGWILREPYDGDKTERFHEATDRLRHRIESMEIESGPQQMLCEDIRELSESLDAVGARLARQPADGG